MNAKIKRRLLALLLAVTMCIPVNSIPTILQVQAAETTETPDVITLGQGTAASPYQIFNGNQLSDISNKGLNKHYIIMDDIVMNSEQNWNPIGTSSTPFSGVLNGNDHSISNLNIQTTTNYVGLFGYIKGATIQKLTLSSVKISGGSYVGSLAGYMVNGSIIDKCFVQGQVIGSGNSVGGLIGYLNGGQTVKNSGFGGNVRGQQETGGIVGRLNSSIIYRCYNLSNVNSTNSDIGGLAGAVSPNSRINESFNLGMIQGGSNVGGIAGRSSNTTIISDCYNRGEVKASGSYAAGITGDQAQTTIIRCYSSGNISGTSYVAGLNGHLNSLTQITYSANMASMIRAKSTGGYRLIGQTGLTSVTYNNNLAFDDMVVQVNYTSRKVKEANPAHNSPDGRNTPMDDFYQLSTYADTLLWDMDMVWKMPSDRKDYPVLRGISENVQNPIYLKGTTENPHLIYTEEDLRNITSFGLDRQFKLMNDIVITSESWTPIGTSDTPFTGTLDGNGFAIKGLTIDSTSNNRGLFGAIYGATVKNLSLLECHILGYDAVGAITGISFGTTLIDNCHVTGQIQGNTLVGGLVGDFQSGFGIIRNCSVNGIVMGWSSVGGIIGKITQGTISDCSAKGQAKGSNTIVGGIVGLAGTSTVIQRTSSQTTVQGTDYIGGIAGRLNSSSITDCFSTGTIKGTGSYIGGIVGRTETNSFLSNCYATGNIAGSAYIGGIAGCANSSSLSANAAMNKSIIATLSKGARVVSEHQSSTSVNSSARNDMVVSVASVVTDIQSTNPDHTSLQGINVTEASITESNTYLSGLGWDFENIWDMPETLPGYPILRHSGTAPTEKIPVTGIELTPAEKQLQVGENFTVIAAILPANATNQKLIWYNTVPSVATVSNGVITAISQGTTTIKAETEDGKFIDTCIVTVTDPLPTVIPVNSVELSSHIEQITVGDTLNLTAKIHPIDATNKNVTWSTSNSNIVSVSNHGTVTAMSEGTATITVTSVDGGFSETCEITVLPKEEIIPENLAGHGKVYASHTSTSYAKAEVQAVNVADGDPTTRWLAPSNIPDVTLTIEFDEMTSFNQIKLTETIERINSFQLEYWSGTAWCLIDSGTVVGKEFVLDFPTVTGTKVQLRVVSTKSNGASIGEFGVYLTNAGTVPDTDNTVDLARFKTISASSVSGSNTAKKAVDGDSSTRWGAQNNTSNVTLDIDFTETITFNKINIGEYGGRIAAYQLQYWNGSTWISFEEGLTMGEEFETNFAPITASKLRLLIIATKGVYGPSISDFEVYNVK